MLSNCVGLVPAFAAEPRHQTTQVGQLDLPRLVTAGRPSLAAVFAIEFVC